MNEEMNLKQFIEEAFKTNIFGAVDMAKKLIELEAIENYLNLMFGIELDIKVKPVEVREGRFYGKSVIEKIGKEYKKEFKK